MTNELRRKLEELSTVAAQNMEPDGDLRKWIETVPAKLMQVLVGYHLIDHRRAAASKRLIDHLDDYEQYQIAQGITTKQAHQVHLRVRAVFSLPNINYWSDVTVSPVQRATAKALRQGKPLKIQTRNHYLSAVKSFCNWMDDDGRTIPIADALKGPTACDRPDGTIRIEHK